MSSEITNLINFSQVIMETESRETQSVIFVESSSTRASLIFARMLHDVSCPMDEGGLEDDEREGRRKEGHDRGGRPCVPQVDHDRQSDRHHLYQSHAQIFSLNANIKVNVAARNPASSYFPLWSLLVCRISICS